MEDPYATFRIRALALARSMGFEHDLVNEAIGILDGTVGGAWLAESETAEALGPSRVHGNPLRHLLQVAGEVQIAETLELCQYLIEPAVTRGKGDIGFSYAGQCFVAECYSPQLGSRGGPGEELELLSQQILDGFEKLPLGKCVSVAIQLLAPLTPVARKEILRTVRNAIATWPVPPRLTSLTNAIVSVVPVPPAAPASVRPILVHPAMAVSGSPDSVASIGSAPRSSDNRTNRASGIRGRPGRFALRVSLEAV